MLIITPVKDSVDTAVDTFGSVCRAAANVDGRYIIYNDFSTDETCEVLRSQSAELGFEVVDIEDFTTNPSPNYRLVLQMAQHEALLMNVPLVIIESDVTIQPDTLYKMLSYSEMKGASCGMTAAVTVDEVGQVNFPYLRYRNETQPFVEATHALSFCCTLLTPALLQTVSFADLNPDKDWFDVYISRLSRRAGFHNFLLMNAPVLHRPHSSRPWKRLKYTNPLKYYFIKYFKRKDKI